MHNAQVCVFDGTYYKMVLNDIGVAIILFFFFFKCSMNPFLPVHLMIHITKLHLPTTFPKPLSIVSILFFYFLGFFFFVYVCFRF